MTDSHPYTALTHFVCQDLVGITRGRGFATPHVQKYLKKGVGWVPANLGLNPFDEITENPWGSVGDLLLFPDSQAEVFINTPLMNTPMHFFLSDIVQLDGSPWDACVRTYLKQQIQSLESLGIRVLASFEHEFMLTDIEQKTPAFSLLGARDEDAFTGLMMNSLEQAKTDPEMCIREYAQDQYEITCGPTYALEAADRAVIMRDVIRETARSLGRTLSFSPKVAHNSGTNGVHIHLSLWSTSGDPLMYDASTFSGLSEIGQQFTAGIHHHIHALTALTAPSVVSYLRLRPHSWSAAYACIGMMNREASIRISPINRLSKTDPKELCNIEYRPADATASPYLALGALLAAGIDGIKQKRQLPLTINQDPSEIPNSEHKKYGMSSLPCNLDEALEALKNNSVIAQSLHPNLLSCYLNIKQSEIKKMKNFDEQAICQSYQTIY